MPDYCPDCGDEFTEGHFESCRASGLHPVQCGIEDWEDEDGPHRCDRRAEHDGEHSCQCAYRWSAA